MMWLRKSKKGFTLIELMVVVAIIGVLALLGLRLYTGQQAKAKEAIVKANAGTVQTLIQSELADGPVDHTEAVSVAAAAGLRNPFAGTPMEADDFLVEHNTPAVTDTNREGDIHINVIESGVHFEVQGYGLGGIPIPEILTARR